MGRVIGFSLKLEGSQATINDLSKIDKALEGIRNQINSVKSIDTSVLKNLTAGQAQFKAVLDQTNKLLDKQASLIGNLGKTDGADNSVVTNLLKTIEKLKKEVAQLKQDLNNLKSPTINVPPPDGLDKLADRAQQVAREIKDIAPAFESLAQGASLKFLNQIAEIDIRLKQVKENIKSTKTGTSADAKAGDLALLLAEEKALLLQKKELTAALREEEKAILSNAKALDPTSVIAMREQLSALKKEYLNLGEAARESKEGLDKLGEIRKLNDQISSIEQATGDFRRNVGNYRDAITGLIPTLEKLNQAGIVSQGGLLKAFQEENKAKVQALTQEVNKLSLAYQNMTAEMKQTAEGKKVFNELEAKLKELGNVAQATTGDFGQFRQKTLGIADIVTGGLIGGGLLSTFSTVFSGIKNAIDISSELSDLEADVRKTTGLTIEQVKRLEESFKQIDTRTSTAELLKIAAVAGQLGVQGEQDITAFTKAVDVLTVALGDELGGGVDQVSSELAKLSNVLFGASTDGTELADRMLRIGNTLNVLGANSAATADKIVDFGSRIGRSLAPLGVGADQILALAATFDELNLLPEQGATAVNNLIKDIGANTKLFADTLKLNRQDLEAAFNTDPLQAFDIVLKRLAELSGGDNTALLQYLKDLKQTGEGVSGVVLQLSANSELFSKNLGLSSKAILENSSLFEEFRVKNETLAGTFDKLSKRLQDIASNPAFVQAFEKIAQTLGSIIGVIAEVITGFSQVFERLTNNVTETGKKVESGFLGMSFASLKLTDANFTLLKGVKDLNDIITREEVILKNTISTLQDETVSRNTKKKLIDDLLAKYPGLINQYELEVASQERLKEIQTEVTSVLRREIFERIKLKTREALETQLINEEIRIAELELGKGLTNAQEVLIAIFGRREEVLALSKKQAIDNLADIRKQISDLEKTFEIAGQNIGANELGNGVEVTFLKVRDTLVGLTNQIESALESTDVGKRIKEQILELSNAAVTQLNALPNNASQEQLNAAYANAEKLIKDYESAIKTSGKGIKDQSTSILKEDKETREKQNKAVDDQIKRLKELRRQIEDLRIADIDNEFDQRIAEVTDKYNSQIKDIEDRIKALKVKQLLTSQDEEEIRLSNELIDKLGDARQKQIDDINDDRNKSLEASKNELLKLKAEIDQILRETAQTNVEVQLEGLAFDLSQQNRTIEITYKANLAQLNEELARGEITQAQYNTRIRDLDRQRLNDQLKALQDYEAEARLLYQTLYNAQLKVLQAKREEALLQAELEASAKRRQIQEDLTAGRTSPDTALGQGIAVASEEYNTRLKIQADFNKEKQKLDQELVQNQQQTADQLAQINEGIAENQAEGTEQQLRRYIDQWQFALNTVTELAQIASDSIFQINSNRMDDEFKRQTEALDREREARLKLVKGNAAEEERINREFDQKKRKLEKEQFDRQQRMAVIQAVVNGAMAITSTFAANPGFADILSLGAIRAIQIGIIAAQTAAQIAVIRSQKFAEGGFGHKFIRKSGEGGYTGGSAAPPDETGKRPVGVAVFHANEYTATEEQVRDHKPLFDALEKDRILRRSGGRIPKSAILAAVEASEKRGSVLAPRKKPEPPVLYQPSYFVQHTINGVEFSEEAIGTLAGAIADKAGASVLQGVENGFTKAVREIAQEEIRKFNFDNRKAV